MQKPQDILQLLLDAEATSDAAAAVGPETTREAQKTAPGQLLEKIVNFGAKKLSIEVCNMRNYIT